MSSGKKDRSRDPEAIAKLIAELMRRVQAGGHLSIDELRSAYPDEVEQLQTLIPTLKWLSDGVDRPDDGPADTEHVPRVLGDFELIREIGRGGMGVVYEAKQISLQKRVALKVLPFAGILDQRTIKRFRNEAMAAAQLEHPHIVPVYHVGHDRGVHYFAMQYIDGSDLAHLIHELEKAASGSYHSSGAGSDAPTEEFSDEIPAAEQATGRWPQVSDSALDGVQESFSGQLLQLISSHRSTPNPEFLAAFVKLGIELADALQYAHEMGVVHRDIKPSNVLLDSQGNAWVADFGLAQIQGDPGLTFTGDMIGTLRYMSPEQALAKRVVVDHRTDIYSLGVTLYEFLTLKQAFQADSRELLLRKIAFEEPQSPRKINRRIPDELEIIVTKALAKNPDQRYQTAGELADDLRHFQNHEPISARRPTALQRAAKWSQRHRTLAVSAAIVATIIFTAAIAASMVSWYYYEQAAVAYEGERGQREETQRLLAKSEGLRLVANSSLELDRNPGLALLLALEGGKHYPSHEANNALLAALEVNHEEHTLIGHQTHVRTVRFNADSTKVITTGPRFPLQHDPEPAIIWDARTGTLLRSLRDERSITSAVFSPDGVRILATSSPTSALAMDDIDGQNVSTPSLFDGQTGQKLTSFPGAFLFETLPNSLSPDGRWLVTPALGHVACIWDCIAGHKIATLVGHERRVVYAAFNPDGSRVVTYSDDNTVRIWDAETGTQLKLFDYWAQRDPQAEECLIDSAVFSPKSDLLITGSSENGLQLWDLQTDRRRNEDHWSGNFACFTPDGSLVVTYGLYATTIFVYETHNATRLYELDTTGPLNHVEVSADGRFILTCGENVARVWLAETGAPHATFAGHTEQVRIAHFNSNSDRVVTGGDDKTARLWRVESYEQANRFDVLLHRSHPIVAVSPDSERLLGATASESKTIVWDLANGQQFARTGRPSRASSDGGRLIFNSELDVTLWSLSAMTELGVFKSANGRIWNAQLSPNGRLVAVRPKGGPTWLWKPDEDRRIALADGNDRINELAFGPDSELLATACEDGYVRLWNCATGALTAKLLHDGEVLGARFSPSGDQLLTVTDQNVASVWDPSTGEVVRTLSAAGRKFNAACFTFDGTHILTYRSNRNAGIQCWNAESGELVAETNDDLGRVNLACSPTRSEAVVASEIAGAYIWDFLENSRTVLMTTPAAAGVFSLDGERVIVAGATHYRSLSVLSSREQTRFRSPAVQVWDRSTGELTQTLSPNVGSVRSLRVAAETGAIIMGAAVYNVRVFDTESRGNVAVLSGHAAPVSFTEFLGASKIVTASWDQTAAIWDVADQKRLHLLEGHQTAIVCGAIDASKRLFAAGELSGNCSVWDTDSGERLHELKGHTDQLVRVEFSPDGQQLLTASQANSSLWDLETGELLDVLSPEEQFQWVAFSADGKALVIVPSSDSRSSGTTDYEVQILDILSGERKSLLLQSPPFRGHFAPRGDRLITLAYGGNVLLWDAATGGQLSGLPHPRDPARLAQFLSDDRVVTSGSLFAQLWDATGAQRLTIPNHHGFNRSDSFVKPFSPNGKWVLTTSSDFGLRRTPIDVAATARQARPRVLTPDEKKRFYIAQ